MIRLGWIPLLGLLLSPAALASGGADAEDAEVRREATRLAADLSLGITAVRSGHLNDASGPAPRDVDMRRMIPGGVIALGAEGPRRRGVEVFAVVTGVLREEQVNEPPLFGTTPPRPTRVALGLGPRAHLQAGIDGALGPRAVELFGTVGPLIGVGLAASEDWRPAGLPNLRLGVHGSVGLSTPLGGDVELHTAWRSLVLADIAGSSQRRTDPWHVGLLTVGIRLALNPDRSPSRRSTSPAPGRPDAGGGPG